MSDVVNNSLVTVQWYSYYVVVMCSHDVELLVCNSMVVLNNLFVSYMWSWSGDIICPLSYIYVVFGL